jgi:hypothetical protein
MVLIALRLLMPPGICACKWSSPAARLLVALAQSERDIPSSNDSGDEDDDAPGCPASPLAVGMGVKPPSEPLLPPGLSLDPLPPTPEAPFVFSVSAEPVVPLWFDAAANPLYLTLRTLLV